MLLEVVIENDSRELSTRLKEIEQTIGNMTREAKKHPDITLSLVGENNFVRLLTLQSFKSGVKLGNRPDTSLARLKVKTNIPTNVADSYKLARKLAEFVENIEEVGRTEINSYGDVAVSVVNPYQYRAELVRMILKDVNATTSALGTDYKVILKGMDKGIYWTRSGDLNLAFYMNYSYEILPSSLQNYTSDY